MLDYLVSFALRLRGVVLSLAVLILGYGVFVALRTKLDVFPEFAPPMVAIQTEAPGFSPEQVEALVTRPLEASLNGAPDLDLMQSDSIQGLSSIVLTFNEDADNFRVRQMVNERLAEAASSLPAGVKAPRMGPLTSTTSHALSLGLTSKTKTPMELRTFADWTLRPRLLGVPGVSKVDTFGGEVRQLLVEVNPDRLRDLGVTLDDVLTAARSANAIHGAGFVENANQRIVLRADGQATTTQQIGETLLRWDNGNPLRIRDVATVREAAEPRFGDSQIDGERGVLLAIHSGFGANTLAMTRTAEDALEEMKPLFDAEGITLHAKLFRPATFIERSLEHIRKALLIGTLMVALVLWIFLLDWRTSLISFSSIPLSLLAAVIVLHHAGVTLNTITLGGFAIAIGVVVDDAIIDVENILRRLRENAVLATPRIAWKVVLDASLEVRHAVVYATFIVALVFLPVLTMGGVLGRLFSPLAVSFLLATMASLAVALTVTPAMCLLLLGKASAHREPRHLEGLRRFHRWVLNGVCQIPRLTLVIVALAVAGAGFTLKFFGGELVPEFLESHLVVHMAARPGASLDHSIEMGKRVAKALLEDKRVLSVAHFAGRAELGEDTFSPDYGEMHVELAPMNGEEYETFLPEFRVMLEKFPGLTFKAMPFLVERMGETMTGTGAAVAVNLVGEDFDTLDETAEKIKTVMEKTPGAVDVAFETLTGAPTLRANLRHDRLSALGFTPAEVLETIEASFQGAEAGQVYEGNRVTDVAVRLAGSDHTDPERLGDLELTNKSGLRVPLRELAEISQSDGRLTLVHEGSQRRQQVTCNVEGRDPAGFLADLKARISRDIKMPKGIFPIYGGAAESAGGAKRDLLVRALLAGAGVLVLLAVLFPRPRSFLLVLANLPFALVGGVLAVYASGGLISIGSLVGFVTLFGISLRNSIMMISHFEHLVTSEGCEWNVQTALRGAGERLVPILMTALVTGLGLLPLALGAGEAGGEIEGPMAVVILGGLITSTLLNLFVLPAFALKWGRFAKSVSEV